jgi:hypothetical protein
MLPLTCRWTYIHYIIHTYKGFQISEPLSEFCSWVHFHIMYLYVPASNITLWWNFNCIHYLLIYFTLHTLNFKATMSSQVFSCVSVRILTNALSVQLSAQLRFIHCILDSFNTCFHRCNGVAFLQLYYYAVLLYKLSWTVLRKFFKV